MNCPRPNAIATLLTSDDFLPGAQALLYSLRETLPQPLASAANYYPPELIVLITPDISQTVRDALYPAFCTRLIEVDPIAIPNVDSPTDGSNSNASHVASWSDTCGYTKLHIFRQPVYSKILYIDSDCLVQKDISHLFNLHQHETPSSSRRGLVAAAPDIFPPDKFNAGVMLISPSQALFDDLLLKTTTMITYDGGDTGFLNAYFHDWHSYPSEGRLGFQFNAQRLMHQWTYEKQPKYWDVAVGEISIIHYSSSPKPWQNATCKPDDNKKGSQSEFLTKDEADKMAHIENKSKALDKLWIKCYKKSIHYKEDFEEEQKLKKKQVVKKKTAVRAKPGPAPQRQSAAQKKKSGTDFNKRFKELRKEGMDAKDAMKQARNEFGLDKNDHISAGTQVAAMFGMPM